MADESGLSKRVYKTVGRHFVSLSCIRHLPNSPEEKIFVFSGFLVLIADDWFYVTAGHILRDIQLVVQAGASFSTWRLDDQTAGNRFNGAAIPFEFDLNDWIVIENQEVGLDYAAVKLDNFYRRALAVGGAEPIDSAAWSDHVTEHDYWVLMGIPSETVTYDSKTIIEAKIVLAPLQPALPPRNSSNVSENYFFASIIEGVPDIISDIDGMSGGPIFSLTEVEGKWFYNVIGVQSAWYKDSKVIAACPFSTFAAELEKLMAGLE